MNDFLKEQQVKNPFSCKFCFMINPPKASVILLRNLNPYKETKLLSLQKRVIPCSSRILEFGTREV
jgi:hypothetical protein